MPRGHAAKREKKKPKKIVKRVEPLAPPVFVSSEVEVIKKKRKPREEK